MMSIRFSHRLCHKVTHRQLEQNSYTWQARYGSIFSSPTAVTSYQSGLPILNGQQ